MPDESSIPPLLEQASEALKDLAGRELDIVKIRKPLDEDEVIGWSKSVSKLSPMLGNMLEYEVVRFLNENGGDELPEGVSWERQDPGFPDAGLIGIRESNHPGVEIKAWFPLATEITGRFKESQVRLDDGSVRLAVIAWLPEFVLFGKPRVIDVFVCDALTIAQARDNHYYNPPDYLVVEPGDTSARTRNLQQTNTNGFKLQTTDWPDLEAVKSEVEDWEPELLEYSPHDPHQAKIRDLQSRYQYRGDTNYAKIDRIAHPELEAFKTSVSESLLHGKTIREWSKLIASDPAAAAEAILALADAAGDEGEVD